MVQMPPNLEMQIYFLERTFFFFCCYHNLHSEFPFIHKDDYQLKKARSFLFHL